MEVKKNIAKKIKKHLINRMKFLYQSLDDLPLEEKLEILDNKTLCILCGMPLNQIKIDLVCLNKNCEIKNLKQDIYH